MPSYVATVSSSLMRVLWPAHSAKFDLPNGGVGFVTSFASTNLVLLIARRGADAAARDGHTRRTRKREKWAPQAVDVLQRRAVGVNPQLKG